MNVRRMPCYPSPTARNAGDSPSVTQCCRTSYAMGVERARVWGLGARSVGDWGGLLGWTKPNVLRQAQDERVSISQRKGGPSTGSGQAGLGRGYAKRSPFDPSAGSGFRVSGVSYLGRGTLRTTGDVDRFGIASSEPQRSARPELVEGQEGLRNARPSTGSG